MTSAIGSIKELSRRRASKKRLLLINGGDKSKYESKTIQLESPTSISMKNSFIIKNADPSFD